MGIAESLFAWEREDDAAKARAEGRPVCIVCGWGSDDPELEVCCDCFDAFTMKAMLRGEYGADEQAEMRASVKLGQG